MVIFGSRSIAIFGGRSVAVFGGKSVDVFGNQIHDYFSLLCLVGRSSVHLFNKVI